MAIVFNCPHCGELHRVRDELAGKLGKCKKAECRQQILIPFKSTASPNGQAPPNAASNAEALAAAALSEETKPAAPKDEAPVKKITIACTSCDRKFEVDSAMQGKNTRCPECGHVFRVPKSKDDKPADWRDANKDRPSMAKSEPAPEGAWDTQRKGVSGDALRKAGAHEVEEEEEPGERRLRRAKQVLYGLALVGIIAFAVIYIVRSRRESATEKWMEKAIAEVDHKEEGAKRPEFSAAIHRYAGEYFVRAAKKREDLDAAMKHFAQARGELQKMSESNADRNGMLIELGVAYTVCGGDGAEVNDERRLPWEKVSPEVRKTFNSLPAGDWQLRVRAMRLLTRTLTEKGRPLLAVTVAQNCCNETELPKMIGRIGIELLLMGKKEDAEKVLAKAPPASSAELTALWLGLHPDQSQPPRNVSTITPPNPKGSSHTAAQRLAYAEGYALQGKFAEAKTIAELPIGAAPDSAEYRLEALTLVAAAAIETGRGGEAGAALDSFFAAVRAADPKEQPQSVWLVVRAVDLSARAGKTDMAKMLVEAMRHETVKSWARLEILRAALSGQEKRRADETWVEPISDPATASLAAALARAEVARHNAAAGESSYTKLVEGMTKGTIRPFGYAGTALGNQDRNLK